MRPRLVLAAAILCSTSVLVACGSDDSGSTRLDVSAASSLKRPLTELADQFGKAELRLEFAGSDRIAAAISAGRLPDVVVLAGSKVPDRLFEDGRISRPVTIGANQLVVAVPTGSTKVNSIEDLAKPGLTVALGGRTVPIGSYADKVIAQLPKAVRSGIAANVKTREPDAAGVVGKLTEGAVDAAIVYRTDVVGSSGKLRAIEIPAALDPRVVYQAALVTGTPHPVEAEALVASLRTGPGQRLLLEQGFLPPPPSR
ncbi:MAG: molybdate ABC transporter substrate-binding protein [Actinomycetes bacterium]